MSYSPESYYRKCPRCDALVGIVGRTAQYVAWHGRGRARPCEGAGKPWPSTKEPRR